MNHWYHMDMNYRGVINMLVMCGCVGQSGGGWSHYVGQEKLRPQTGWAPLAFAPRLGRPPRQHELDLVLLRPHRPVALRDAERRRDPVADRAGRATGTAQLIDYNIRAERMGWLPSAPQLKTNPLDRSRARRRSGQGAEGLCREAR
jgi:nitrate reductase alpha subunit